MSLDPYATRRQPPCWGLDITDGKPNHCKLAHADHILRNHIELHGPWAGWRLAGRDLVAPTGERISERRLRGLIWRQDAEDVRDSARKRRAAREAQRRQMVKVVVIDLADWQARHLGTRAG